jgi:hypothetical protein
MNVKFVLLQVSMTVFIVNQSQSVLLIISKGSLRCHDIQLNDIQHKGTHNYNPQPKNIPDNYTNHNNSCHSGIEDNSTQQNGTEHYGNRHNNTLHNDIERNDARNYDIHPIASYIQNNSSPFCQWGSITH